MNLRQPYEQVIADKLRQLRPPDADASWQQMKRLLDEDQDKGAGGKRPPGNGWWRTGLLAVVLITSAWLFIEQKNETNQLAEKNIETKPANVSKTISGAENNKTQTTSIENNTTLTTTADNKNNAVAENNAATNSAASNTATKKANDAAIKENANNTVAATNKENNSTASNAAADVKKSADTKDAPATVKTSSLHNAAANNSGNNVQHHASNSLAVNSLGANTTSSSNKKLSGKIGNKNHPLHSVQNEGANTARANDVANANASTVNESFQQQKNTAGKKNQGLGAKNANNNNAALNSNNNIDYIASTSSINAKEKSWFDRLTELKQPSAIPSYNTDELADDSIAGNKRIELSADAKKAVAKAKRDNEIALLDKKEKKSLHLNLSNLFKPFSMRLDAEPWWAAGLAINGNIPLTAQNRFNYNMNAKSSTLTDYIPSPYLQFHLNNYVYFQTELNFVSPQFTPQLLAFKESNDVTTQSGVSEQKSIFIQKMYYFNWPVSLHYSPISNLYFSAGLQFSSFQSGLASIEKKQYVTSMGPDHANNINTEVLKFKDDSIAAKIAPNEWRWQVGAEYYIDRFSIGMRYNQSFKNAVNSAAAPSLAPTVYRNQSMLFFIRYNLFESRTKVSVPKNQ